MWKHAESPFVNTNNQTQCKQSRHMITVTYTIWAHNRGYFIGHGNKLCSFHNCHDAVFKFYVLHNRNQKPWSHTEELYALRQVYFLFAACSRSQKCQAVFHMNCAWLCREGGLHVTSHEVSSGMQSSLQIPVAETPNHSWWHAGVLVHCVWMPSDRLRYLWSFWCVSSSELCRHMDICNIK